MMAVTCKVATKRRSAWLLEDRQLFYNQKQLLSHLGILTPLAVEPQLHPVTACSSLPVHNAGEPHGAVGISSMADAQEDDITLMRRVAPTRPCLGVSVVVDPR